MPTCTDSSFTFTDELCSSVNARGGGGWWINSSPTARSGAKKSELTDMPQETSKLPAELEPEPEPKPEPEPEPEA